MAERELKFRGAPYGLMIAMGVFIIAVPLEIDCCEGFRGWLKDAPLFREMIARSIITEAEIHSFEIELYVYFLACIVLPIIGAIINYSYFANFANKDALKTKEEMENIRAERKKGVREMALFVMAISGALYFFTFASDPRIGAQQGLKGWHLLKVVFTGEAFMIGLLVMLISSSIGDFVHHRNKTGNGVTK